MPRTRTSESLLVSAGVHVALVLVVRCAPPPPPPAVELSPLTFELTEPSPPPEPEPTPRSEPAVPAPPTEARPAAIARPTRRSVPSVALIEPSSPAVEPEPSPAAPAPGPAEAVVTPAPRALTREEQRRLIDPTLAIPRVYVPSGPGPSRRGPPAGRVLESNRPTEQELEAQHSGFLRERAMVRAWLSRSEPELHRQPDGSYLYDGHAFAARIRPDGSVDFQARDNVRIEGPDLRNIPFDIDNMIHDVYSYERQRFMDRTEELRDRLDAEHRSSADASALRVLPGRLRGIWEQSARTPAARRRRIFDLWDQAADDETGRAARAIVTRWVRDNLPEGSAGAYTGPELARLNAQRESSAVFAPY